MVLVNITSSLCTLNVSVFFGAMLDNYITLPPVGKDLTAKFCKHKKTRIHEFKANHLQVPEPVNKVLLDWITSL